MTNPTADVIDVSPHTQALAPTAGASPLPVFAASEMVTALTKYKELQRSLDHAMPDAIMQLDGKQFRKKGYWRAVALAFNLTVEPIEERYEERGLFDDGRPNFGYIVTYRASQGSGRFSTGDGACFAVEKARRFRCTHPEDPGVPSGRTKHWPHETCPDYDPAHQWKSLPGQATDHNIRGHAHTRAFNRAVSNLVGFGEVSAEEVSTDEVRPEQHARATAPTPTGTPARADGATKVKTVSPDVQGKPRRITLEDGRSGTTFDKDLIKDAEAAKASGAWKIPRFEEVASRRPGGKPFLNIVALDDPPESDDPPDEPELVETIIVLRPYTDGSGRDWLIVQGSEREYKTDDDAIKAEVTALREKKVPVVFVFDQKRSAKGWARKLTGVHEATPEELQNALAHDRPAKDAS